MEKIKNKASHTNENNIDGVCQEHSLHKDIQKRVLEKFPKEEDLINLAEFLKIFGDSTRIKILYALYESEMCVCDMADMLEISVSAISHQLRILKNANLVKFRRCGKTVIYSLADNHISSILSQGMEHISE